MDYLQFIEQSKVSIQRIVGTGIKYIVEQHCCAGNRNEFEEIYKFIGPHKYIEFIEYRLRWNELKVECLVSGEKSLPL